MLIKRLVSKGFDLNQIIRRVSHLSITATCSVSSPVGAVLPFPTCVNEIDIEKERYPFGSILKLPGSALQIGKITLPSLNEQAKLAPSLKINEFFRDPSPNLIPFYLPPNQNNPPEMRTERALINRHRRLKKHHRKKRFKRDLTAYKKHHKRKKLTAEKHFRDKIDAIIAEASAFSPEDYVDGVLRVHHKKEPVPKLYEYEYYQSKIGHWTEVMPIEQLFGLPATDRIDKKTGFAAEDDLEEIKRLRKEYKETFMKLKPIKKQ